MRQLIRADGAVQRVGTFGGEGKTFFPPSGTKYIDCTVNMWNGYFLRSGTSPPPRTWRARARLLPASARAALTPGPFRLWVPLVPQPALGALGGALDADGVVVQEKMGGISGTIEPPTGTKYTSIEANQ
jgi:hypothetical protein